MSIFWSIKFSQGTKQNSIRNKWEPKYKVGGGYKVIGGMCFAISSMFLYHYHTYYYYLGRLGISMVMNSLENQEKMLLSSSLQVAYIETYYNEAPPQRPNSLCSINHMLIVQD
jgi:hypothetical protein